MRVSPSQVVNFLGARGWKISRLKQFPQLLTFTHPAFEDRQIFLPEKESAADYNDALLFLLDKLASIEGRKVQTLIDQLERSETSDVSDLKDGMAFRILKTVEADQSIPLAAATALMNETSVILKVGSCTAENPRHYYRRIDNKTSSDIYSRTVFNHTQRGSFILSISCPIAAPGEQLGFGLDREEWTKSRRAFVSIYEGMRNLTNAVKNDHVQKFTDETLASESPTVSANFCEALANIAAKDTGEGVSVGFEWSPYVPLPIDIAVKSSIYISPFMADGLYMISEALRPEEMPLDDTFIGTVEALRGDVTATGERAGSVEFSLLLRDGTNIRASADLSIEQYKIADKAHIEGARYISIAGRLTPHPRVWEFDVLRSFNFVSG
jgi:hypothetical protein